MNLYHTTNIYFALPSPPPPPSLTTHTSMAVEKSGDLLRATEDWVCHQTCCVARKPHGLSASIASSFPHANVYAERRGASPNLAFEEDRPAPGTVDIRGTKGADHPRGVVALHGQWAMGQPGKYFTFMPESKSDTSAHRQTFFGLCLAELAKLAPCSVAIPHQIGCGLAGGNWETYRTMIETFAVAHPDIRVTIYRLA